MCLRSPEVVAYSFPDATQIIASIEASHTSDQSILSETLDIQPPAKVLSDKTAYGDRRMRASLSRDVNIRYVALVENNVRRLLPESGRQHLWSDIPSDVLAALGRSGWRSASRTVRSSEFQDGSQPEHGSVLQDPARLVDAKWVGRAPARVGDVLKVRLQRPAGPDFVLIDSGDECFHGYGQAKPHRSEFRNRYRVSGPRARRVHSLPQCQTCLSVDFRRDR